MEEVGVRGWEVSGREERGEDKEKTQEILDQGNDLLDSHLVSFHMCVHMCTIWNSLGS